MNRALKERMSGMGTLFMTMNSHDLIRSLTSLDVPNIEIESSLFLKSS